MLSENPAARCLLLMYLIVQKFQDQILCFIDSITCTVDTQVIIIRFSPVRTAIEIVIFSVLVIHLL